MKRSHEPSVTQYDDSPFWGTPQGKSFIISNYHSFAFDQFALRAVITLSVLINTIINNSATQVPYFPYSFQ